MGMKTLILGMTTLFLFLIGFTMLAFGQLMTGIFLMFGAALLGAIGWIVVWFGNDLSLLFSKIKFFKAGAKSIVFFKDKSNKLTPYFIDPSSKTFNVNVMTTNGIRKEPILVGKADGSLKGTNISTYWGREGVHATFGMDDKISMGMEGAYIHSLVDASVDLGKALEASGNGLLKKGGIDWMLMGLIAAVAFAAIAAYMAFTTSGQIGAVQASVDTLRTAMLNAGAVDINSITPVVTQPVATVIPGVI